MKVDRLWPQIDAYRQSPITLLTDVADDDWQRPSLRT